MKYLLFIEIILLIYSVIYIDLSGCFLNQDMPTCILMKGINK